MTPNLETIELELVEHNEDLQGKEIKALRGLNFLPRLRVLQLSEGETIVGSSLKQYRRMVSVLTQVKLVYLSGSLLTSEMLIHFNPSQIRLSVWTHMMPINREMVLLHASQLIKHPKESFNMCDLERDANVPKVVSWFNKVRKFKI